MQYLEQGLAKVRATLTLPPLFTYCDVIVLKSHPVPSLPFPCSFQPQTLPHRSPAETPRALCGFSEPRSLPGGVGTLGCCGPAGLQAPGLGAWARAVFVNSLGGS